MTQCVVPAYFIPFLILFALSANADSGKWVVHESSSQMDDSKTVVLRLDAENTISGWLKKNKANLFIRCKENRTEVYIHTGMAANPEYGVDAHTVRIRLDKLRAFTERWSESTDNEALFAKTPISLAKKLAHARTMLFEFTPFNANPATSRFDVRGLDQHLNRVAQACGWDEATLARRRREKERKRKQKEEALAALVTEIEATVNAAVEAGQLITFEADLSRPFLPVCSMKRDSFYLDWAKKYEKAISLFRSIPVDTAAPFRHMLEAQGVEFDKKKKQCEDSAKQK